MPTIYSAFHNSSKSGIPVTKSLSIDYSFDDKVFYAAFENQFLFCDNLLVMPVESNKEITKIYLPKGDWYHLFTGERFGGNQEMFWECPLEYLPVFVKSGAILAMQSATNHADEMHDGHLNLHIYKGQGLTKQSVYEDDGKSTAYQQGHFSKTLFTMDFENNRLTIEKIATSFKSAFNTVNVFFYGTAIKSATLNEKGLKIAKSNVAFLDEISSFDPLPDGSHSFKICKKIPSFSVDLNDNDYFEIDLS